MFEVVGALFSMFVQFIFFSIRKFTSNKLGCEYSKVSQSDLQDLRGFFMFEEAETAGSACV